MKRTSAGSATLTQSTTTATQATTAQTPTAQEPATTATPALSPGPAPAPAPVPLWRNLRFQALWAGQAASTLGMRIADTAYPLLLLAMTGSSTLAGAVGALQIGATVLFGVHGGAVADRYDRRRVLIAADSARLLAAASVPLALWLGGLTVPHALLVAVVLGATIAYGGPVRLLAVRSVVPPEQLRQALAQDEARMSGAGLVGPPLAGYLFGAGRAVPFLGTVLATAVSLAAALVVRFPGRPERTAGAPAAGAREARTLDGFRHLAASPLLRPALAVVFVINLTGAAMLLPVIVLLRGQGTSSGGIGLALAGEAVGAIAGAFLVGRLHRLAGPGVLLLATAWICVPVMLAPLLPGGAVTVFAALFVVGLGTPALRVMIDILIFQQVADEFRGRVIAATMTLFTIGMPAGMLGSGLMLDHLSPAVTLAVLTAVLAAALLPATAGRTLRRSSWPGPTA
ncbi:MFS transporter [Kitasatospora sp. NPDC004240]